MANLSNINGKFVVEQTTGFVGIGTTDPGFLIEAAGTNAELALNASSIYRVRSTASDEFIITKNGVGDRLTISGGGDATFSGRVGLNGTTPSDFNADADDLIVGGGSGDVGITMYSGSSVGDYGAIYFADGTTGSAEYKGIISYEQNNEIMRFHTNTTEALRLDLSQNATFAGDILTNTDSSSDIGKTGERWANIWVDNINGSTPTTGGPYLPLAGGTMTGQLTNTTGVSWGTNVKLINTNDNASPPILSFEKAPTSGYTAIADNDYVGFINFRAKNDNDQIHSWVELSTLAIDVSDGSESSAFRIGTWGAGTEYANTIIAKSGKVGIGTASPQKNLQIFQAEGGVGAKHATIRLGGYSTVGPDIAAYRVTGNSNDQGLIFSTYDATNGTVDTMTLTNAGNVGIGTTSPDALLELEKSAVGAVGPTLLLNNSAGGGGDKGNIIYCSYGTTYQRAKIEFKVSSETDSPGNIDFYTGRSDLGTLTQKMTILGSGKVGIGNSNPSYKLDIAGTSPRIRVAETTSDTANTMVEVENSDGRGAMLGIGGSARTDILANRGYINAQSETDGLAIGTEGTDPIVFYTQGVGTSNERMRITSAGMVEIKTTNGEINFDSGNGYVQTTTGSTSLVFGVNSSEKMRIHSSGNVGIGTTSPDFELEVAGSIGIDDYIYHNGDHNTYIRAQGDQWTFRTGGDDRMHIDNTGVGIGGASSGSKLEIIGGGYNSIRIGSTQAANANKLSGISMNNYQGNGTSIFQTFCQNGSNTIYYGSADSGFRGIQGHYFMVNSNSDSTSGHTTAMLINSSGNVGIGTTSFASTSNLQLKLGNMGSGVVGEIFDAVDNADNSRLIICGGGTGTPQFSMRHYSAAYGFDIWMNTSSPWDVYFDARGVSQGFIWRNYTNNDGGEITLMDLDGNSGTGTLTVKGDLVAYGSPSDVRLKENIKPIESALDKVSKLQGVTFDWKESDSILDIKEDIGFIAQDVQKVVPELVRENEDGKLSLRDKGIVPILVEAIKELKAEIEELKKHSCDCKK